MKLFTPVVAAGYRMSWDFKFYSHARFRNERNRQLLVFYFRLGFQYRQLAKNQDWTGQSDIFVKLCEFPRQIPTLTRHFNGERRAFFLGGTNVLT